MQIILCRLNPKRPGDLKESFNTSSFHPDIKWPSADFLETHRSFFQRCKELSLRVLRVMALSLGLDPDVFIRAHALIGTDENKTTLRSLYYPPVKTAKENQLRCGEHSDYGSITLVFQGSDGLQVCARSGEFIAAPVVSGAILVNIADLMQRWTADRFISVCHRVLLPPEGDACTRQSLAFFVHPDDEALISCCDGSSKYPPITAGDYVTQRFNKTYEQAEG
uniref:Fe2OG dioxygenase domain-containing protein n=1 Tax=Nothobranchius kuhntae TaxID=321403 RepID=A0A1A8JFC1_NOTKU